MTEATTDETLDKPDGHLLVDQLRFMAETGGDRVAYAELLPDESAASAVQFLQHAVAWLSTLGVHVEAVMTDNAFCYVRRQYTAARTTLGLRHLRTRPYTPRTQGKPERFTQPPLAASDASKL